VSFNLENSSWLVITWLPLVWPLAIITTTSFMIGSPKSTPIISLNPIVKLESIANDDVTVYVATTDPEEYVDPITKSTPIGVALGVTVGVGVGVDPAQAIPQFKFVNVAVSKSISNDIGFGVISVWTWYTNEPIFLYMPSTVDKVIVDLPIKSGDT